jgi:hypothetical protein
MAWVVDRTFNMVDVKQLDEKEGLCLEIL